MNNRKRNGRYMVIETYNFLNCLFLECFLFNLKNFQLYGDVSMINKDPQILTNTLHSKPLSSDGSLLWHKTLVYYGHSQIAERLAVELSPKQLRTVPTGNWGDRSTTMPLWRVALSKRQQWHGIACKISIKPSAKC